MASKRPRPPLECYIEGFKNSGYQVGDSCDTYAGLLLPKSLFTVTLLLSDQLEDFVRAGNSEREPKSDKTWLVELAFNFSSTEPHVQSVRLSGLGPEPSESGGFWHVDFTRATEPPRLWQFQYVADNFVRLQAFALEQYAQFMQALLEPSSPFHPDKKLREKLRALNNSRLRATPERLQRVAEIYKAEVARAKAEGGKIRTTEAVADQLEERPIDLKKASYLVGKAREAGYLPRTTKGKTSSFESQDKAGNSGEN